jgi:hypothetical protein
MELNKKVFIIFIVCSIIVVGLSLILKTEDKEKENTNIQANSKNTNSYNQDSKEVTSNTSDIDYGDGLVSSGAGSSSSSSGGSSSSSGGSQSEETTGMKVRIPYALENFNTIEECLEYDNQVCIKKTTTCQLNLKNLDKEVSGNFEIRFSVLDSYNEEINYDNIRNYVPASFDQEFVASFNILGNQARENITCIQEMIAVPTKFV